MTTSQGHPRDPQDPHAGQTTLGAGPTPEAAAATLVLMHGRGGSAEDILSLYTELRLSDLAALAPRRPATPGTRTRSWRHSKRTSLISTRRSAGSSLSSPTSSHVASPVITSRFSAFRKAPA